MALNRANWPVNSYSVDTWTNLVAEAGLIASLIITNAGAGTTSVELQLDNGAGVELVRLLPATNVTAGNAFTFDMRSLVVTGSQRVRFKASAAGISVIASGVVTAV
jgi:hypothetical protein